MEQDSEHREVAGQTGAPRWDLTGMSSAYCNIATATALRDSIAVSLGVTQAAGGRPPAELRPELLHRIVLAPLTAQRLHQILGRLLGEYATERGGRRRAAGE